MDASFAQGHYRLGQVEMLRGRYADAVPHLEKAIELSSGSPRAVAELGLAHALLGHPAPARTLLADLDARARTRYVSPFDRAVIYGGLDDRPLALEWLEKAEAERSPSLSLLLLSPAFVRLHGEPRFDALVRRLGLGGDG
jgi:tetratricopeptide (TPR) repeat protein